MIDHPVDPSTLYDARFRSTAVAQRHRRRRSAPPSR
jgi:hypothetical protein